MVKEHCKRFFTQVGITHLRIMLSFLPNPIEKLPHLVDFFYRLSFLKTWLMAEAIA
jgi:hypothetical protein